MREPADSLPLLATREQRRCAVVYQIYPRSFQDSNGDGIGDIAGITARLDYLQWLGVDAIWLSPIFLSPMFDMGYDVADYCEVDPMFGTLADVDDLVSSAHVRGIGVLLDIVPCHTSIEHPWFREHPDWYVWHDGDSPPNNWVSVFGGPAWSRDEVTGLWYLHSFYREQPQLNWRDPEVPAAIEQSMRFWLDRGIDGFRIDALQFLYFDEELRDEPERTTPMLSGTAHPDWLRLDHVHTLDLPDVVRALEGLVTALPEAFLIAEVYADIPDLIPYTKVVDLTFCLSLIATKPEANSVRTVLETALGIEGLAWSMSNHDISRLASRWGEDLAGVAAMLLLSLPGSSFVYQGDEIGMTDGPGCEPPLDRIGRDAFRHPMQWVPEGGFTTGIPWLLMANPERLNVQTQRGDDGSLLQLYHKLLALRKILSGPILSLEDAANVLILRRGPYLVVLNFGELDCSGPDVDDVVVRTRSDTGPHLLRRKSGYIGRVC